MDLTRSSWRSMLSRCSPRGAYTRRGIAVCEAWRWSFDYFLEDMGPRPSSRHSIERLDNEGDYEPGNCVWALPLDQVHNRRNTRPLIERANRRHEPRRIAYGPGCGYRVVGVAWLVMGPW